MGLSVSRLVLTDFRNFHEKEIKPSCGMTILLGRNARGKTNTIEALQLLTAGASFRNALPRQLLREGCEEGKASAVLTGDGRVVDVALALAPSRRRFTVNGKTVHSHEVPRTLMSVLFTPDDLQLIKGGATGRRRELDDFARQANKGFERVHKAYTRGIEQRNHLLKEGDLSHGMLDVWDESIARSGAALLYARLRLLDRLRPRIEESYAAIAGGERLSCAYESTLGADVCDLTKDELCERMVERLLDTREEGIRRQQTVVGPHRDDVVLSIEGRDARAFGSQGQQRTAVLAIKMAEVEVARDIVGQAPLLLLDDVMSELDEKRRASVAAFSDRGVQTVITTTNLGYFSRNMIDEAEVIPYDD